MLVDGAYLVVEVPGLRTPGIDYSASHPDCVIDLAAAPLPQSGPGQAMLDAVVLVRNPGPDLPLLRAGLTQAYGPVKTLDRDPRRDTWLASLRLPLGAMRDPAVRGIEHFLLTHKVEMQWIRIEQGSAFARCQVPAGQPPHALADEMKGYLEGLGLDGSVAVETGSPEDGPWRELVGRIRQHSHPPA